MGSPKPRPRSTFASGLRASSTSPNTEPDVQQGAPSELWLPAGAALFYREPTGGGSDGKPKLRLEKTVSKSVSSEGGSGFVQITFSSQEPVFGMLKLARPS